MCEGSDALVIATEWEEFRALDLDRLKREMTTAGLIDLRNIYRPDEPLHFGFTYDGVGRSSTQGEDGRITEPPRASKYAP
jgi:UDPglucose 6-dehydrogenase